jgi:hypothetical protein
MHHFIRRGPSEARVAYHRYAGVKLGLQSPKGNLDCFKKSLVAVVIDQHLIAKWADRLLDLVIDLTQAGGNRSGCGPVLFFGGRPSPVSSGFVDAAERKAEIVLSGAIKERSPSLGMRASASELKLEFLAYYSSCRSRRTSARNRSAAAKVGVQTAASRKYGSE